MTQIRHYLHGDSRDADGLIYCSRCDLFVPLDHFYGRQVQDGKYTLEPHRDLVSDYDVYLRTLEAWEWRETRYRRNGRPNPHTRPQNARNWFA
jgi:hypothetical protein